MESNAVEIVRGQLLSMADEEYQRFTAKLVPNVPSETIIGVRAPELKNLVQKLETQPELCREFRRALPHMYHDENLLHAYMLAAFNEVERVEEFLKELEQFLPYVDTWAVCDALVPKIFAQHPPVLEERIPEWLRAERSYTIRFAIVTLTKYHLEDFFDEEHFQWLIDVASADGYVTAAQAWYFTAALAKRYEQAVPLLENEMLEPAVHTQTIQKAINSHRIPYEHKKYLRTLKLSNARSRD